MSALVIKKQLSGLDNKVLLPQSGLIAILKKITQRTEYDNDQNDKNG